MPKAKTTPVALTSFDRATVRQIMDECREALAPVAEKYGLVLDQKGSTYHRDALPVMLQFLIKRVDKAGNVISKEAQMFLKDCVCFGLKPDDLGREFMSRGRTFRIIGVAPRSTYYPIIVEELKSGKTFKMSAETVVEGLKRAA